MPPSRVLVLGASGRGKTTFIVDRLINRVYRGLIDKIYLISATANHATVYRRIKGNVTRLSVYHPSLISKIMRREVEKYQNKRRVLWFFDDIGGQGIDITLRPTDPFVRLASTSRHLGPKHTDDPEQGTHIIIFGAQCTSMVPTAYRKNHDDTILFGEDNEDEMKMLYKMVGFGDYDLFTRFLNGNITKPYDFMHLHRGINKSWWKNMTIDMSEQVEALKKAQESKLDEKLKKLQKKKGAVGILLKVPKQ